MVIWKGDERSKGILGKKENMPHSRFDRMGGLLIFGIHVK